MRSFAFVLLAFISSCSDTNFKKVEELKGFRILAVIADTPEVSAAGGMVNMQLYVSDVESGGRAFTGTTVSCIDPGISLGASVSCNHDPNRQVDTYTVDTTAGDPAGHSATGLNSAVLSVTVPSFVLTGRSSRDQFNGVGYITIFRFRVDGEEISVFKRISVTNRGSTNDNPSGASLLVNQGSYSGIPDKDDRLAVTTSDEQTFQYETVDGTRETRLEKYQIAWYASSGEINKPKSYSEESVKFLKAPKSSGSFVLVAVVRDERGGVEVIRAP